MTRTTNDDLDHERESTWRDAHVRVGDVQYTGPQPLNEHLTEVIGATMAGERTPDVQHVPVRNLVTRDEDVVPAYLALLLANPPAPPRGPVTVVEFSRRRYWAFDDTHSVRAWQQSDPDMLIAVDVLQRYESSASH